MCCQDSDFNRSPDIHCGGLTQVTCLPEPVPDMAIVDDPCEEPHCCDPPNCKHDLRSKNKDVIVSMQLL